MQIFALGTTQPFGELIAGSLGVALSRHEERRFEDGEHKFRPLESVRGRDVYVVSSLYSEPGASVNDKFCQFLFFLATLKDAGAARVTAVAPYFPYARKDRRTKPRDPLGSRYVAQLLEAVNVDCVMTVDVHNVSAFENAFRRPAIHLDTRRLFAARLRDRLSGAQLVVASPDPGGVKRAQLFREAIEETSGRSTGFVFMEKRRSADAVSGAMISGDVAGATVLIIDDLISTGGTMARAAAAFHEAGAAKSYAIATHGLFVGEATEAFADSNIERIFITNTIPPFRLPPSVIGGYVETVDIAPLFAEAIRRLHVGGSISDLLGGPA